MDKTVPVMLPRTCIPCEKIEDDCYDWYQRHNAKLQETKSKHAEIVFIGDYFKLGTSDCVFGNVKGYVEKLAIL